MGFEGFIKAVLVTAALWLLSLAAPAAAEPLALPSCHAGANLGENWQAVAADPARWRCDAGEPNLESEVTVIRYAVQPGVVPPLSFVSHYGKFAQITLIALDRDGTSRSRNYAMDEVHRIKAGPFFSAPLPKIGPDTVAVYAAIEHPWINLTLTQQHLDSTAEGTGWPIGEIVGFAMICGILLVPLLLNAAFYWVMPERYVLWHLLMVSSTLVQATILTGLVPDALALPLGAEVMLSDFSFATLTAGALMFLRAFLEPRMLSRWLSRAMVAQAVLGIVAVPTITLLLPGLRPVGVLLVHLVMLPCVVLLAAAMIDARRRGSSAVLFQIVGWTPALLVATWRIASFTLLDMPSEAPVLYHAALAFEVMVTAVAIVSRFAGLRRERDQARDRFEQLEGEAERDPLTGLFNRRGIEDRFTALRRAGFDTMAVIDLDHFKAVNDARGHAVGDRVLAATGLALEDDPDLIAWRLGGEEFLLLLRGRNAARRAEARRQAIPARVATLVPGLPGPVTASMGVVELPRGTMLATSYAELYAHADRLLYEAKRAGRNRMVAEKLTLFIGSKQRERATAA